ncbi:hypothetical protein Tco_0122550 [Tanacetum coccineum]
MKSSLVSRTTARPVNIVQPNTTMNSARPLKNVFNKAHSTVRRPINNNAAFKNSNFNIVKDKNVNVGRPKAVVNTARPKVVVNAFQGNHVNVVKASACWVWKQKTKIQVSDGLGRQKILIFLPYVQSNPQQDLKELKGQKEAKTVKKPTRNERDKKKSEETARNQSRISPIQQERKSKVKIMKSKDQE